MPSDRLPPLSRRRLLGGAGTAAAATLLLPALTAPLLSRPAKAATGGVLKVGDQRATVRSLLEASGQLKDLPYTLEFADFPAAAPVLEALNAGAIDAGFAGDAAHAFALSNGLPAKVISATRSDPGCIGILVRKDSPIKTVADLKGRTITTVRGSIGHYLAVAALKANGLSVNDVTLAFLQPSEAKSAFSAGTVDAWSIWTLYIAQEVVAGTGRVLVNGRGLAEQQRLHQRHRRRHRRKAGAVAGLCRPRRRRPAVGARQCRTIRPHLGRSGEGDAGGRRRRLQS